MSKLSSNYFSPTSFPALLACLNLIPSLSNGGYMRVQLRRILHKYMYKIISYSL